MQCEIEQPDQGQGRRVIVFDGDSGGRDIFADCLIAEGFQVTTTDGRPNTFDQIAALQPNLVVIDLISALMTWLKVAGRCWSAAGGLHVLHPGPGHRHRPAALRAGQGRPPELWPVPLHRKAVRS